MFYKTGSLTYKDILNVTMSYSVDELFVVDICIHICTLVKKLHQIDLIVEIKKLVRAIVLLKKHQTLISYF